MSTEAVRSLVPCNEKYCYQYVGRGKGKCRHCQEGVQ